MSFDAMKLSPHDAADLALAEVARAMRKFPTWPRDAIHAAAVVAEECGELQKAALQMTYEPHKTSLEELRTEAIQTAAMALRFLMSIDRYVYDPSRQLSQATDPVA